MPRVLWLQVAALSSRLPSPAFASRLAGGLRPLRPVLPAVTCTAQATLSTGQLPQSHGIVANGIYTRRSATDQAEVDLTSFADFRRNVSFWEQANTLVQAPRFWQGAPKPIRTAMLFWQNSMPGFGAIDSQRPAADIVVTPKPVHGPDGKTLTACWSEPADLYAQLVSELGPFPLHQYWGPMASLPSSAWIAKAAAAVWNTHKPDLQLVYLPHLDYALQKFGPDSPQAAAAVAELDGLVQPLLDMAQQNGDTAIVVGDYGIVPVSRCVQPNRLLADAGLLKTKPQDGGMGVDYEQSAAFAMVDHQIAHVYCQTNMDVARVQEALAGVPGIARIAARHELSELGLHHPRSGDLLLLAEPDTWFAYYWAEPAALPAWARGVDIHRKPGYDPLEMFFVPQEKRVGWDVTQLKGSHGLPGINNKDWGTIGSTTAVPSHVQSAEHVAEWVRSLLA